MRILAVEDGGFPEGIPGEREGKALLVGVITSNSIPEKILLSEINVDGLDATKRLVEMVKKEKRGVDLILLASISYAGFNPMDPKRICKQLRIPVLVVNPKKPDNVAVESALMHHFSDWRKRLSFFKKVGTPKRLAVGARKRVYFHAFGIPEACAEALIKKLVVFGNRPEPLRIARILAHELSRRIQKPSMVTLGRRIQITQAP